MAPAVETAVAAHQEEEAAREKRTQDERPAAPEALMSAMRRAAATDDEYQRWLQSPPPHAHANRGLLFDEKGRMRVPADAALRTRILAELHDSTTGAHCGRDRMLPAAQRRFTLLDPDDKGAIGWNDLPRTIAEQRSARRR